MNDDMFMKHFLLNVVHLAPFGWCSTSFGELAGGLRKEMEFLC